MVETERPVPGPGEVLVRVRAAGVNPTDWIHRATGLILGEPPFVLGWELSGVVEAVGLGVTIHRPGDEVFGMLKYPYGNGAHAEYAVSAARHLVRKPAGIDHVRAAAVPLAALTAWQALVDTAGLRRGQRVLVHAAAGGVGHLAVQIAKARGAYVVGTASAPKRDFVRGLGADEVVDYTAADFAEVVRDVDVVLDAVGGEYGPRSLRTLRRGGVLVSIVNHVRDLDVDRYGVRAEEMLVETDHASMKRVAALVEAGRLRVAIDSVFPLADAARAHERGETGRVTGKVVLTV
ncbi:NADPH:quinone reductase-like Zn-dependent oxidoreductase [Actinomadura namibiensis]|uniref:NADPH:quinone reductase-like Zn-dependent oxidoreductase n=1 Tax=Actinomadura namibiensis TaxID=182080 RepID=A0A7W3QSF1_ACTNM|nr:NADPH:quinone reductase-like Zn-dependent oxidoreductase [Actinomadura namibiensis]